MNASDYLPYPINLDVSLIREARSRLAAYIKDQWADLDVSPRSPFGDLVLTPAAYMEAAYSAALTNFFSDLNLTNLAGGLVYNEDVADAFLTTLGASAYAEIPAFGVVKMRFTDNKAYELAAPLKFQVNSVTLTGIDNGGETGTIRIGQVKDARNIYVLTPDTDGGYSIYVPVSAPAATRLLATSTVAYVGSPPSELVGLSLAADMSPGIIEETIAQRARRARERFATAGFSTRANLVSYLSTAYPQVSRFAAFQTGDREITRRRTNLLGIVTPETDVYLRSGVRFSTYSDYVKVKYDLENNRWVGAIPAPFGVTLFDRSAIFQSNNFDNSRNTLVFFARSGREGASAQQVSFSLEEVYGLAATSFNPESAEEATVSDTTFVAGPRVYEFLTTGAYCGSMFDNITHRHFQFTFRNYKQIYVNGEQYWALFMFVRDLLNGDGGPIVFIADEVGDSTPIGVTLDERVLDYGDLDINETYRKFFYGLSIHIVRTDNDMSTGEDPALFRDDLELMSVEMSVRARSANFFVQYQYDPYLARVGKNLDTNPQSTTHTILARAFCVSELVNLDLYVTLTPGSRPDLDAAREAVADYLNDLRWPKRYQESDLFRALAENGVEGLDRLSVTIIHHTTPADYHVNLGVASQAQKTLSRDFYDVPAAADHTARNHMFYVHPDDIHIVTRIEEP